MDAVNDPEIEMIVLMASAQVGKTEILNNIIGYFIDQDPAPMLVIQPTLSMGKTWSEDRLSPMVRDTPRLSDKIKLNSRDGGNTIFHKKFPGGHITIAGANSPASLASRPVRIVILDEVERFPNSAGDEGDPTSLAEKRTTTFWNRKIVQVSTPTTKQNRKIGAAYDLSDMRKYFVPCPHCAEKQVLTWERLDFKDPENPVYICEHNGCVIDHSDKTFMLKHGEWRATGKAGSTAGFYLNELYSPWSTWRRMVETFLKVKHDPTKLKTFVNTALGEEWDDDYLEGDGVKSEGVAARAEEYKFDIPDGVALLTAGVDIQDDRIEGEILGHGLNDETWSIDYFVIHGNPGSKETWQALDDTLENKFYHESGAAFTIACACIDSGGHFTDEVYQYAKFKKRQGRTFFPIKGSSSYNQPIVAKPSLNNAYRVKLFSVGTDTAKDTIYSRLLNTEPGPGFCHFPLKYDDEYYKQLTAEKKVTRYLGGKQRKRWEKPKARRNEALDCRVYNLAAFAICGKHIDQVNARVIARIQEAWAKKGPTRSAEKKEITSKKKKITTQEAIKRVRMKKSKIGNQSK